MTLCIRNIGLLATPVGSAASPAPEVREIPGACVVAADGLIEYAGPEKDAPPRLLQEADRTFDARGMLATPGLVDAHTHLVFGGWRQHEVELKLRGAGYLDILRAGGGILSTVEATRATGEEALLQKAAGFLKDMLSLGVTSCEIKSGYGLDTQTELKQLRVTGLLAEQAVQDIVPTFLGAHAVPPEFAGNPDAYVDYVCADMIPTLAGRAKYCDVFCETGVFDVAQSRRVLETALSHGLLPKIHCDEIEAIGGSALAGELKAVSAEHLIAVDRAGMESMARGGVIAVLLPGTSFYLGKPYAPAGELMAAGVPVALASDFNPGSCPSYNLQLVMNLAYLKYGMHPRLVLCGVTLNAACAIGLGDRIGTLEKGKQADLVLWDAPDLNMLCYRYGSNQAAVTVKRGKLYEGGAV